MGKIADVLARKGTAVHTVDHETTVFDAVKKMVDNNLGSVIVTSGGEICGIFTERDYLRRIVVEGRTSRTTSVHEVMGSRLVYVAPSGSIEDALTIMTQERIRHLPVVGASGNVEGMLSLRHLLGQKVENLEETLDSLAAYVSADGIGG